MEVIVPAAPDGVIDVGVGVGLRVGARDGAVVVGAGVGARLGASVGAIKVGAGVGVRVGVPVGAEDLGLRVVGLAVDEKIDVVVGGVGLFVLGCEKRGQEVDIKTHNMWDEKARRHYRWWRC